MCTGVTIAMLAMAAVGTGYSMYAADTQANQQESNLKFQADQMAADAAAARGEAEVEAMRIRKAGKAQRAQAVAAAAASGVDVNSPTALKIDEDITKNAEEDATLTILGGKDRAARMGQQSQLDRAGASVVKSNARMQNTGTLLSAVGNSYTSTGGWKFAGGT